MSVEGSTAGIIPPAAGDLTDSRRVFRLLVLYRWLSLIPPALALPGAWTDWRASAGFSLAVLANVVISLWPERINRAARRQPALLLADLMLCAGLAAVTGGWDTPYYLYSFSPLLAAAFFIEFQGALWAALAMAGLFVAAGLPAARVPDLRLAAEVVGFLLIGSAFGYAASLLAHLRASHGRVESAHRDLAVIHELTLSMQSAADVDEVVERVLDALTRQLRFSRALLALVEPGGQVLSGWRGRARPGTPPLPVGLETLPSIPLNPLGGPLAHSLLTGQAQLLGVGALLPGDGRVPPQLGWDRYHLFPMVVREHPVGVLLVSADELAGPAQIQSLQAIASQAAVAVGTTMLCIDRAQRLAVQDERIRIAREIHDSVAQSLFGLTYSLDACIKLLPGQPEMVRDELGGLLRLAENTRAEVRQSILDMWPSDLTAERFRADLERYVADICLAQPLEVEVQVNGDFTGLPPGARRSLYRVAQEALTNTIRHAQAGRARVCLSVGPDGCASLAVHDDGRGFEVGPALAREHGREHFGLRGMLARATAAGGEGEVVSRPGAGTWLWVEFPAGRPQ